MIWETLRHRKKDTVENLASEFCVSERTIRRDIGILLTEHPITTVGGRYGGVFVLDTAMPGYFSKDQERILRKAIAIICENLPDALSEAEKRELDDLLRCYSKESHIQMSRAADVPSRERRSRTAGKGAKRR